MTDEQLIKQFQQIEDNFNVAVISNSVNEIKKCVTRDWVLVDSQGGIIPQEGFFNVLEQGLLSHSTMTKEILRVKVYGDNGSISKVVCEMKLESDICRKNDQHWNYL